MLRVAIPLVLIVVSLGLYLFATEGDGTGIPSVIVASSSIKPGQVLGSLDSKQIDFLVSQVVPARKYFDNIGALAFAVVVMILAMVVAAHLSLVKAPGIQETVVDPETKNRDHCRAMALPLQRMSIPVDPKDTK